MKITLVCIFLLMLLAGPASAFAGDETVLAKAGAVTITSADLNRVIGYYTPEQQEAFRLHPEYKFKLLKKLMQEKILSADAKLLGLDKDPGVREQIEIMTNGQLASELLKREITDKISVSDKEAGIYYQLHKEDFKTPEAVRARHILVKVDKDAGQEAKKAAMEKALSLLKRIRAGEDFGKVAGESSDDPGSKSKGGDLGFFQKGQMVPEFEAAAFSLKPGEVSDIVETKFGYHIIKCEEKGDAGYLLFEGAKQGIIEKLLKQTTSSKIEEYLSKRMADEKVEFYPDRLPKQEKK